MVEYNGYSAHQDNNKIVITMPTTTIETKPMTSKDLAFILFIVNLLKSTPEAIRLSRKITPL